MVRRKNAQQTRKRRKPARLSPRLRDLLADIVENSGDAIFSRSLDGTITSWNQSAERIFGYSAEEIIGKSSAILLPPGRTRETAQIISTVRRGERVQHLETVRLRKNGDPLFVSLSASPIRNRAGEIVGVSTIARDITAERELHNQLLEAGEKERRRIGRDLHDSLGQQIFGMELLCRSLQRALIRRGIPEVNLAQLLVRQMKTAVRDVRALSRGLTPVAERPDGLMIALEDLAVTTRTLFRVNCSFECDEPVLIAQPAAANHMFRIAQEAVTNAIRHGRSKRIRISLRRRIENLALEIQDWGSGLRTPPPGDHGMGLRVMHYRAARLGGSLEIKDTPPQGVLVSCVVPLQHLQSGVAKK